MRTPVSAAVAFLALAGLLPLCAMVLISFRGENGFDLHNYASLLNAGRTWALLGNSALLAALTTATSGLLGVPLAILLAKTDLYFRNLLATLLSLPLLFPPYILAVGWSEILGRGGILTEWLGPSTGAWSSRWLFGLPGVVLVLTTAFLPIVLILTMTYLRGVNPALEESARMSAGWPLVLRRISIPLAAPGIVLAGVLVFLLVMGEFGAPSFLRLEVFPVASFTQLAAFYDFGAATAAAMPLALVALLGLGIEARILGGKTFSFPRGQARDAEPIRLGRSCPWLFTGTVLLILVLVAAPLAGLTWRGLSPAAVAEALDRAGGSALRSVAYAGISATLLAPLGFLLAYLIHRRTVAIWRYVDALGLFLFTLPGTVLGVGLIVLWNRPQTSWIYTTPAILVLGFAAQYSALATRTVLAGFAQVSPSLEEAAQVAGASWPLRVRGILIPLVWPVMLLSWVMAFLFSLRDVSLPLLLAPPGRDTLTARTMTLMANGSPELIAALCLLLLALAAVPLGVLAIFARRWAGRR